MNTNLHYEQTTKNPPQHFGFGIPNAIADDDTSSEALPSAMPASLWSDEPTDITRVDFTPFKRLKAKIDAITFSCTEHDQRPGRVESLRQLIKDGRIALPRGKRNMARYGCPCLAVHDPSLRDLKVLVERFWNSKVMRIEFAIDAHLPPGSNDLWLLDELKGQLRHCLFPQRHQRLRMGLRKRFVAVPKRQYRNDALGTPLPDTQIIWEDNRNSDQLALYIKTIDNGSSVGQPWVRMEARLEDSGPSAAGIARMGMLPNFSKNLRANLAPMFWIASGFKNIDELGGKGVPKDPWTKWGAQWPAGGRAKLQPDTEANKLVGEALNELRDSIGRIPPPTAVAHRYDDWVKEMTY